MSSESLNSVFSGLPPDCPVKLKKIIDESRNPNEILDNLLKVLGDISNEPHLANMILEMIPKICSETEIQLSEIEFAILSFQNIYNMNLFKTDVKCKLLEVIVTVLLSYQLSREVTDDCVQFLLSILENKSEPAVTCLSSLDCLLEIEMSIPEILKEKTEIFVLMLNHEVLKNKASEIISLIMRNTTDPISNQSEILRVLIENLPTLCPLTMATVTRNILNLCVCLDFQVDLEKTLEKLMERYKDTFDLCVLQTIISIQERHGGITNENPAILSSTHPALPVGSNLIALDWLTSTVHLNDDLIEINRFEPTYFDGADARLKKILFLNKTSLHQSLDPGLLCHHFGKLVAFAVKNATSRAFAAVFRVMRNMIESKFPTNAVQIVVMTTVELGAGHPACLPHIVDFLKHLGANRPDQSSEAITLGLTDAFDEMETALIEPHFEQLIQFFTESTTYQYEFCQPRMILHVIKNCLSKDKKIKSSSCGAAVLELCQALIRNQDYEIFQPELKTVLSLIETSQEESDIKQRAWMLRSLITHVNTDSLKDAFDVDMNLSSTGKVVSTDYPLISLEVLFDYNLTDTMSVTWSLERKRSCRSFYFPLEVRLAENEKKSHQEYFGIQVDFIVDAKWGRAESLYIPVLEVNQVKKACLQLQPFICSATTIEARVVMSTTDGRIYVSHLEPIRLKLEHLLSPLSSSKSFTELWDQLTSQSEKCYSSALHLLRPEKLLQAVEQGKLDRFQMSKKKPTELAMVMVTPDSFLVLVQILSVKNSWHAEILVENPSVLPVVKSLLTEYST